MVIALCFSDSAQLAQTFRMHVFAEGGSVLRYRFIPCFVIVS